MSDFIREEAEAILASISSPNIDLPDEIREQTKILGTSWFRTVREGCISEKSGCGLTSTQRRLSVSSNIRRY